MNERKLRALIDETVALDRQIEELDLQLKERKRLLVQEAESRTDEHTSTDGGGWSWRCEGESGCAVTVSQPCPSLRAKIDGEGKTITKIREAAGAHFSRLFEQAPSYKLIPAFREEALGLLGRGASKLIKLVTTESAPRVAFETKKIEI